MTDYIENGDRVKDRITGFEGVVTGRVEYLTGCAQALVAPKCKDDGSLIGSQWFDVDRLDVLEAGAFKSAAVSSADRPGSDEPAPTK